MSTPATRVRLACAAVGLAAILVVTAGRATRAATAVKITAGGGHTCAITSDDRVECWGANTHGQLGNGSTINSPSPVEVPDLGGDVGSVAAGGAHTCALTSGGAVKCWGYNGYGQLGDGSTIDRLTPVDVVGLTTGVSSISAGSEHTCAVLSSGGVKCWGDNSSGKLGDGTRTRRVTPVDVAGLSDAVAVAAGDNHTCALTGSGGVKCWGDNSDGQLADADDTDMEHSTPVDVAGLTGVITAVAAGSNHTCALTATGGVTCWGLIGLVGNGVPHPPKGPDTTGPVDVFGLTRGVVSLDVSGGHSCAVTDVGLVGCWGDGSYGQLGDGTATIAYAPVYARNERAAVAVSTGGAHTCIVTVDGGGRVLGKQPERPVGRRGADQYHASRRCRFVLWRECHRRG